MKAAGSTVALGALGIFSTGTGAAATLQISAENVTVSNDDGSVSLVTIDPAFDIKWSGFDDTVAKIFCLIEAKVGDGEYQPIYRATPWLTGINNNAEFDESGPGKSGHYTIAHSLSDALATDSRFVNSVPGPLVIADEQGRPDYGLFNWQNVPGADLQSYLDGTSMDSASWYSNLDESGQTVDVTGNEHVPQNNYPEVDAGYYGAAALASEFNNDADGTTNQTTVSLRYTFEFLRPNESYMKWGKDEYKNISSIEASDIDAGNSEIVMNGEDNNHLFATPSGIPYEELHAYAESHVGIIVAETSFDVMAENRPAGTTSSGTSNTEAF
ncbi:hypothetical protein SAMN04487950_1649 [Halogranum rubrum]|uniref:Uncharacterized protein n=2 Tax=Halogranum rubrum TaxID=553466 RepID=A0A1I4D5C4_9EURY|nr:hypothetical protein SAMN04487950_1649 [Halogranum rubrum]